MHPDRTFPNFSRAARSDAACSSADAYAGLFAPLDMLLRTGGDDRLLLAGSSGLNAYGCKPAPRPEAIAFSSSTASSISQHAYRRARDLQLELAAAIAVDGIETAFESRMEQVRSALLRLFGLANAEIVFAPSGTDAQLLALHFSSLILGAPLSCIVVGSDQTGSGTAFTAGARHYSDRTARGIDVRRGEAISGCDGDIAVVNIPFADGAARQRSGEEMDELVLSSVRDEIAKGRKVVLQAMNASKFGWRAPSEACLAAIAAQWPSSVQVVVDACQLRLAPSRLAGSISRRQLVLFTGSKFFCGPAFSGGLLVPRGLSGMIGHGPGSVLRDYAGRADMPVHWSGLRRDLAWEANFGLWLRWEAALVEMQDYFALPKAYRSEVLAGLADAMPRLIRAWPALEPLPPPCGLADAGETDDEFSAPTIFPLLFRNEDRFLTADEVQRIYRALNRNMAGELAADASEETRMLAAQPCHVGQPVRLGSTAALRIAFGSRNLVDAWTPQSDAAPRAVARIAARVERVLAKLELIRSTCTETRHER